MLKISIIIPAKDEQERLPRFLKTVISFCLASPNQYEIIVVDDGSSDQTVQEALLFQKEFPALRVISLERNHGKGYAVRKGAFAAQGDIILFMDADGSTGPAEIERHLHLFDEGYDIVIGSRVVTDGKSQVKTLFYRRMIGIIFNFLVHCLLIKNIRDTQCGFKMFKAHIVRGLFGRIYLEGFGFDLEVLHVAQKMNLRIKEVSVNWSHVDGSKVNLLKDSLRMFWNILQIKNWHDVPINLKEQHMSAKELASMYAQEKEHWWFKAKGEFFKKITADYSLANKVILDAGCGTGHNMEFLHAKGFYVGCDIMSEALEFCRNNGIQHLVQADSQALAFRSKSFDMIISLDVLEHVADPSAMMSEFKRLLKDDGVLVLAVPAFRFLWSTHDESISHMRRYDKKDLEDLVEDSGFSIQRIGYLYALIFWPVAILRVFRRVFLRSKQAQCDTTHQPSQAVNQMFFKLMQWEAKGIKKIAWPFGTSLYTVASKK